MKGEHWGRMFFVVAGVPLLMGIILAFVALLPRARPAPVITEQQRADETMALLRYDNTGDLVDDLAGLHRGEFRLLRFKDGVERPVRITILDRGDGTVVITYPDVDNPSLQRIVKLDAARVFKNTRAVAP